MERTWKWSFEFSSAVRIVIVLSEAIETDGMHGIISWDLHNVHLRNKVIRLLTLIIGTEIRSSQHLEICNKSILLNVLLLTARLPLLHLHIGEFFAE